MLEGLFKEHDSLRGHGGFKKLREKLDRTIGAELEEVEDNQIKNWLSNRRRKRDKERRAAHEQGAGARVSFVQQGRQQRQDPQSKEDPYLQLQQRTRVSSRADKARSRCMVHMVE